MKVTAKAAAIGIVGLLLFLADRWLKSWAASHPSVDLPLGVDFFRFQLATNSGIAFGLPFNQVLLIVLYVLVIGALCLVLADRLRRRDFKSFAAVVAVIVGVFSNLADRLTYGQVIDYLYLKNFSIFNLADTMITIGALSFIIINWRSGADGAGPARKNNPIK